MSWFMGARRFPRLGCLATAIKPMQAWLSVLCCSTFLITHCKWQPLGQPFGSHLAMGSVPEWPLCMRAPPKISIKGMHAVSLGSLSVSDRLGHFMDHHISRRCCRDSHSH